MPHPTPRLELTERFDEALAWSSDLHRNQGRKGGGTPYVAHLLAVCALVLEAGGDEDEAIAALLHDAVEDQGGAPTLLDIRRRFGETIADIVDGCTDAYEIPKPPWRERKTDFIQSLKTATASVRRVVAADKLHNAQSTLEDLRREGPQIWERFRGRDRALWYYREVHNALAAAPNPSRLVKRLEQVIKDLETAG